MRALRHRNFRLFWAGQVFSLAGNAMQMVGESWLVYRLTGSPAALGVVSFIALVPVVPISLFGSALIDRLPKRRLVLITQCSLAVTVLVLALLTWTGQVRVWHLIALTFVSGAIASVDLPARQALVPDLVGRDDLPNGIALNNLLSSASRIVGPLIGGFVIAGAGEAVCFFINGLSFIPLILNLARMRGLPDAPTAAREPGSGSALAGLNYMRRNATLRWLLGLMSLSSLTLLAYVPMMPVIAKNVLNAGPEGYGMLMTAVGVGAMIGSLWLARLEAERLRGWLLVALCVLPVGVAAMTAAHDLVWALGIAVVLGTSTTWMQTIFNTLVQLHVRDDMRGRTMSVYLALSVGMQRVAGLQAGLVADTFGVVAALRLGAAVSLASTLVMLCIPSSQLRGQPAAGGPVPEVAWRQ